MDHQPSRPMTYIGIDLAALGANIRALKRHVGQRAELIAVVKGNAYGHGAVPIARTALQHGATRLAVARVDEGVALRKEGILAPVLVMGYTPPDNMAHAVAHNLTLTVTEINQAKALDEAARAHNSRAKVHIKIDTGMARLGLLPDEALPFVTCLAGLPGLELEGIFSHFASADGPDKSYAHEQFARFMDVLRTLSDAGHSFPVRHIANSAATIDLPETHLDAVRCGIAIYGLRPSAGTPPAVPLQPVLTLKSCLARVRTLPAGAGISYGRTYITPCRMAVGLVPIGYGDGYHRLNSNRGAVLIHGRRAPIVGRVTMDQLVVDLSEIGPASVGDEVVLIGAQGLDRITAEEVAGWAETINYEVTTSLLSRLPRVVLDG